VGERAVNEVLFNSFVQAKAGVDQASFAEDLLRVLGEVAQVAGADVARVVGALPRLGQVRFHLVRQVHRPTLDLGGRPAGETP